MRTIIWGPNPRGGGVGIAIIILKLGAGPSLYHILPGLYHGSTMSLPGLYQASMVSCQASTGPLLGPYAALPGRQQVSPGHYWASSRPLASSTGPLQDLNWASARPLPGTTRPLPGLYWVLLGLY